MAQIENLLESRYYQDGEQTWQDIVVRTIDCLYPTNSPDKLRLYQAMMTGTFLPSSPVLMNAGLEYPMMCSCFVLPIHDNIDDIMRSLHQTVRIQKYGGGVGIDFTPIRPEGSKISTTGGKASGPVSFAKFWNAAMEVIRQAGKRQGALMGVLNWKHPDIETFLEAKQKEGYLTNFNLSVGLDKEFWNKLEFKYEKVVKLLMKMATAAYNNGEPGVLFLDNINANSAYDERITATNPCLPKDSWVLTKDGLITVGELKTGEEIWSEEGWTTVLRKESRGVKQTFKYEFTGGTFYGTADHKVVSREGKIEVDNAENIEVTGGPSYGAVDIFPQNIMDGLLLGDGSWHEGCLGPRLYIGEDDQDYFSSEISSLLVRKAEEKGTAELYEVLTFLREEDFSPPYERHVPDVYMRATRKHKRGFLRGLYSANGSVCGGRITLKTSSPQLREDVQILLSSLGIRSYFTINKAHDVDFDNGTYTCKESYDINITRDRDLFLRDIGFLQKYKMEKAHNLGPTHEGTTYTSKISREYIGIEEVFDITVDNKSHTFWNNGLNVSNCGEVPLPPFGACCLGSINVANCLDYEKGRVTFNFRDFRHYVRVGIRALDRVIAESWWPWVQIEHFELENWPLGLGIMGLADTLAMLGLPYSTYGAVKFTNTLMAEMRATAEKESARLSEVKEHPKHKTLLSIAPTGSISMLSDWLSQFCSYSIEPYFTLAGSKNVEQGTFVIKNRALTLASKIRGFRITEEDREVIAQTGSVQETSLPDNEKDVFRTANEISPYAHLEMQSMVQKHVDNSVSKTINMPKESSVQDIVDIIIDAHARGCKGLTVYRTGSRQDEVIECPSGSCDL